MGVDPSPAQFENLFNQIYDTHYPALYAYLFGRTGNRELAQDLLQEAFTRAWLRIETLAQIEEDQHQYWLFSVAKNLAIDTARRSERWQAIEEKLHATAEGSANDANQQVESWNQLIILDQAIVNLPEGLRVVLAMSVLGGMNSKEISQALGIPPGTVRYQLATARKRLMEELNIQ
ncbi:MAG: sigma-70 family RNA polymerase sigma factor [Chloroflexota bacterium]